MSHPCPKYEPELSAFLDEETPPALTAEIETHLRACAACRSAVGRLRGVSRTLRRWDAHETRYATSAGFRNRVVSKVGAGAASPRFEGAWRVAAAVALVAAGAGGFALVAPRLAPAPNTDTARLEELVSRFEAAARERAGAAPAAPAASPATSVPPIERVAPLGSVVSRVTDDDGVEAPQPVPEVWEERVDRRFLRDALPDHDSYTSERRTLALEELVRQMQESQVAKTDRPTAAPAAPTSPLATFFGEVRVASVNYPSFEQIQVWPIELTGGRGASAARAVPCEEAIRSEILAVTEGSVKETIVVVNNDPRRAVLILAGDVFAGGKQDRVAREDVLVEPGQRLSIPAYTCGKAQRTSYRNFTRSEGVAMPELRALVAADRAFFAGSLGQDPFDDAVGRTVRALASPGGPRGSLDNLFRNPELASQVDPKVKSFLKRLDGSTVVGFAVSAGSKLLGVEMFGDHATFLDHRLRVLRSYVISAIAMDDVSGAPPARDVVAAVVSAARGGAFHAESPAGSGTLNVFRGVEGGAFGFGLTDGTRVVHAVLFTALPAGADPAGARSGRRTSGDGAAPLDGGHTGSSPERAGSGGGDDGVEPR